MDKITALYSRVSTNRQAEEGYSIEEQEESLVFQCKSRGITNYKLYTDAGFSGGSLDRPQMQTLIEDVKNGKIEKVMVKKLDRLSRSQKDTLYLLEDVFKANGVTLISINDGLDTGIKNGLGDLLIGILSSFAQYERETIKDRTRTGMRKRVESGLWMGGGRTPLGYDYDAKKGIIVPNADAERVRKAYAMYLDGFSPARIAAALRFSGERVVTQLLKRKSNCGYIVYNGIEYRGNHEPIISEETYNKAMELMISKSIDRSGSVFLLTGLLACGVCGAKMRYQKWGKSGYRIYCYSQQKSKRSLIKDASCNNDRYFADEVEQAVLNEIFALSYSDVKNASEKNQISVTDTLNKQYNSVAAELKSLYRLYAKNEDEILLESINELKQEAEKIKKEITAEKEKKAVTEKIKSAKKLLKTLPEAWQYMTDKEKQTAVRRLVNRVVLTHGSVDVYFSLEEYLSH